RVGVKSGKSSRVRCTSISLLGDEVKIINLVIKLKSQEQFEPQFSQGYVSCSRESIES
ncbi:unnamed protein product, partial [Callosobruchus maculatus]